jgi:uncharacterized protein (DUF58 family)
MVAQPLTLVGGVAERDLARLRRLGDRLLLGPPAHAHGTSPHRRRAGTGLEFFELRAWAPGDEARDVDWRATARTRRPVVRRYQDESFRTAVLCLDASASMGPRGGRRWRLARELVAALAYLLIDAGNRVGLVGFSEGIDAVVAPARGRAGFLRVLAHLVELAPRPGGGASRLERCTRLVPLGATAIVVSDFLAPDFLAAGLSRLLARTARVQAIRIAAAGDAALSAAGGDVLLRDAESGARASVTLDDASRAAAARALAALDTGLTAWCRRRGVPLTTCEAGAPWRDVVVRHARTLAAFHA